MASRHMQRIRALQEQQSVAETQVQVEPEARDEEASEEEEEEEEEEASAPFNPFDLLQEEEGEEEEAPAEADEEEEQQEAGREGGGEGEAPAQAARSELPAGDSRGKEGGGKKKKSRKKGRKGGGGQAGAAAAAEEDDDLDAIMAELNMAPALQNGTGTGQPEPVGQLPGQGGPALLAVDAKKLRADDELRKIFGSRVVDAERAAEEQQLHAAQRRRGVQQRGGGRRKAPAKKCYLVTPKEHWPRVEGGLSMERCGMRNGQPLFRYAHSAVYASVQAAFRQVQESYDPNNIAALLAQHPFHADALLAMSDLYRYSGENAYSEEMLERCLYALETAWHPAFNPATAACQLDYLDERNRPMFTALFRHMMNKSRQGCHKTALECCKLLLAFDQTDPCGALLAIDYMSLRAQEYDYLLRLVREWDSGEGSSLQLLPNFAFSSALASFMLEAEGQDGGDQAAGDKLLQAVLMYPLVVVQVLEKLQEKGVGKDAWWGAILQRKLFAGASDGGSASLSHVVGIFAERQNLLWKPPEVLKWLRTVAEEAADIADGKKEAPGAGADDWACVRAEVFPPSATNSYRHLQVGDFSDTVNRIPPEELQAGMGGGMEIPPDVMAMLEAEAAAAAQGGQPRRPPQLSDEEMRDANPLMMLLRSMLPWVDVGVEAEAGEPGGAALEPQQEPPPDG